MDPKKAEELTGPLKKFYKGEHLSLGVTQILTGIITIMFGVVLNVESDYYYNFLYVGSFTAYWSGVLFIISGSLSVASAKNPKPSLVKGMVGMNTVSSVAAGVGIILLSASLSSIYWRARYLCSSSSYRSSQTDFSHLDPVCKENRIVPFYITAGIQSVLLLFNILEFCITISNVAFGCKTVCRDTYSETVVVIYQNPPPENTVSLSAANKDAENP